MAWRAWPEGLDEIRRDDMPTLGSFYRPFQERSAISHRGYHYSNKMVVKVLSWGFILEILLARFSQKGGRGSVHYQNLSFCTATQSSV